jgi:hypothetical protein
VGRRVDIVKPNDKKISRAETQRRRELPIEKNRSLEDEKI